MRALLHQTAKAVLWIGLLVVVCTPVGAEQFELAGTWRSDSTATAPEWELFFRPGADGATGLVSRGASAQARPTEIADIRIVGSAITFKCTSSDRDRVVTFTGTIRGDEIALRWTREVRPGGLDNGPVDRMFGPSAPRQFTVHRTADGALARAANDTRGIEFAAAVNVRASDSKTEAAIFLPDNVERFGVVVVAIDYGLGHFVYDSAAWRTLVQSIGGALLRVRFSSITAPTGGLAAINRAGAADALSTLLDRAAQESGHPEVATAPLVLFGHSGGGGLGSILAALRPERTLAFVRYHSGPIGGDLSPLRESLICVDDNLGMSGGLHRAIYGSKEFGGLTVVDFWLFSVPPAHAERCP